MNYKQQKAHAAKMCKDINRYRGACPACGGENSYSVTRLNTGLVWTCFRSSCDLRGGDSTFSPASLKTTIERHTTSSNVQTSLLTYDKKPDIFIPPHDWTSVLSDDAMNVLHRHTVLGVFNSPRAKLFDSRNQKRLYFCIQILGASSRLPVRTVGAVGRYYGDDPKVPKWVVQGGTTQQPFHIASTGFNKQDKCIIVEDAISACKVSSFGDGVALLGTVLSETAIAYLLDFKYKDVYIFLDPDARDKAGKMYNRLSSVFNCKLIHGVKDPKEYSAQALSSLIGI